MRRRRSRVSPARRADRSDRPSLDSSRLILGVTRLALLLFGAMMLAYALRVYFAGIYDRLPPGALRWALPALSTVALAGFLIAAVREFSKLRRNLGR